MIGAFIEWSDHPKSPGYIIAENGCHLWVGAKARGYGYVRIKGVTSPVHRLRYLREVGPIPEGMPLDHYVCSDPGCCNPLHCRPVTERENILRSNSMSARNRAKTHCPLDHELSGDNLVPSRLRSVGQRQCRTCHNAANRRRQQAKRGRREAA